MLDGSFSRSKPKRTYRYRMAGGDSDHAAAVKTRMKPRAGDADRSSHHHPHPATQAWERGAAAPLSLGSSHECQPDSDTELKGSPMACGVAAVPTGPDRHTQLLTCASEFPEDLARRTTARTCLYARLSVSRAVGPTGWRRAGHRQPPAPSITPHLQLVSSWAGAMDVSGGCPMACWPRPCLVPKRFRISIL